MDEAIGIEFHHNGTDNTKIKLNKYQARILDLAAGDYYESLYNWHLNYGTKLEIYGSQGGSNDIFRI